MGRPGAQNWGPRHTGCHRCPLPKQPEPAACCRPRGHYSWGTRCCACGRSPWCSWLLEAALSQRCFPRCLCEGCLWTTKDKQIYQKQIRAHYSTGNSGISWSSSFNEWNSSIISHLSLSIRGNDTDLVTELTGTSWSCANTAMAIMLKLRPHNWSSQTNRWDHLSFIYSLWNTTQAILN